MSRSRLTLNRRMPGRCGSGQRGPGQRGLGRWNLLVLLGSALVTTALGLATQPLVAQTTTAAASAYRQGQFQRAEQLLTGVAAEGLFVDADALVVRGFARYQTGQFTAARRDFQVVLDRSPRYADAWYGLALIARAQGRAAQALTLNREALSIDPDRAELRQLQAALTAGQVMASGQ